jgi:hypothetical protein
MIAVLRKASTSVKLHLHRRHILEGIHDLNAVIVVFNSGIWLAHEDAYQ